MRSPYYQPFLLARLIIGVSFFGHGLVRIPVISAFSKGMIVQFEHSILPEALISVFSYTLPFIEFTIGLLLIIGLFTRYALIAGSLLMTVLVFGCTTIQQWDAIQLQLIHTAFCIVLLVFVEHFNSFALDNLIKGNTK